MVKLPSGLLAGPFFRTGFNYDRNQASDEAGTDFPEPSLTSQDGAEEADINTIVMRFGLTGRLPNKYEAPQYGLFEGIFDYQGALNAVIAADSAFLQVPANIRQRFHNDPGYMIDFVSKEENRAEAEKMGLIQPKKAPEGASVPITGIEPVSEKKAP